MHISPRLVPQDSFADNNDAAALQEWAKHDLDEALRRIVTRLRNQGVPL
jgi:hypothetical protein